MGNIYKLSLRDRVAEREGESKKGRKKSNELRKKK